MKSPKPPDPVKTAQAQAEMNRETAITQYGLGATNQITPYGNLTYEQIGTWEDGTPRFQATTSLSPEQQGLYDRFTQAQTQFGDIANAQLGRVGETLSTPWDLDAETATELSNMQRQFLDPEWQSREDALNAQLAARGLSPGGEAYSDRTREFGDARSRAYDRMYLDAYNTARDTALTERNQPLRELSSMLGMSQPQQPQFQSTPQPGVAPVDYTGLVNQQYQGELSSHNAMMGGLFSIPSAIAGGWASSPAGGAALSSLFAMSDRRLKTDVERIGEDPRGFGVYEFRYNWDAPSVRRVGVMADEVAEIVPNAVAVHPSGWLMVDYGAL